ncbi:mitochondrial import protein 1 [Diutina catenulata]
MSEQAIRQRPTGDSVPGESTSSMADSTGVVSLDEHTIFEGAKDEGDDDVIEALEDVLDQEKIANDLEQVSSSHEAVPLTIDVWGIIRRSAINLVLPFINGMMLGFGEILAHEIGFRYKWQGARVVPVRRKTPVVLAESKFL